ncbi:MAG: hypothetical protein KDB27_04065 [Planctomycetales bacterium]|nr:hypothetical protein [Planctomycetales bacterium]
MRDATMLRFGMFFGFLATLCSVAPVHGQITGQAVAARKLPHRIGAMLPPGVVAREQLMRSPSLQGYMQPIEIRVPRGAEVAVADSGGFSTPHVGSMKVGLNVGSVYRLKVANIDQNLGGEVYPTIEVIDRLHPPEGLKHRFPVPVQITQRDLEHALAGRLVVRVIFLEDPAKAYPELEQKNNQRSITALDDEDPLRLADELGRPMAILRLGSRVPDPSGLDSGFLFGSPPVEFMAGGPVPSPQPIEHFEASPRQPVVEPVPDVVVPNETPRSSSPDDAFLDKQDTVPDSSIAPESASDIDPFADEESPLVDELP